MLKALTVAILVAGLPVLLGINEASAMGRGALRGICPEGCAKDGSTYTDNIRTCSIKNCRPFHRIPSRRNN